MLVNVKRQIETKGYRLSSWLFRGTVNSPVMVGAVKLICIGFLTLRLEGKVINPSVNVKKDCTRIKSRTTTLTERRKAHSSTWQATVVSCA